MNDKCPDCTKYFIHERSGGRFTCWKCQKDYCEACYVRGGHGGHNAGAMLEDGQ